MGKSKSAKPAPEAKNKDVALHGGVSKAVQNPIQKGKDLAKKAASKVSRKDESDSSESSEDESMSDASSAGSEEDSDSSASDVSEEETVTKKVNGSAKRVAADESSESSDSSDDEGAPPAKKTQVQVTAGNQDSESESEESDDSEESDAAPKAKGAAAPKLNGKSGKVEDVSDSESEEESDSEDGSSGSEEDSDSGSDSDSESEEEPAPKKRKAEDTQPVTPANKKARVDSSVGDDAKCNLFVGQLSWNVDEEWLRREFEAYGEVESVNIIMDRNSGRSKGFGYVKYTKPEDGEAAQKALHRASIDDRQINVDFSTPKPRTPASGGDRSQRYGDSTPSAESSTLFVANIAFGSTSDELREAFSEHGKVIGARLPTDKESGRMKGYGYVDFESVDDAKKAFGAMKAVSFKGRPLRLDFSTPRPDNGDRFGGGGYRGGDRGGFGGGRGGGRGRGGFDRGGRGGGRGGRGGSTNRGGFGDFQGKKMSFD